MEILHAKSISKVYKGKIPYKALVDIDLSIQEGEFVGIMGPSVVENNVIKYGIYY